MLIDHPEIQPVLAYLVQTAIEHIGIPTALDWRRKAQKIWSLTQRGNVGPVSLPSTLIPSPIRPRAAQYLFLGRPWGNLALPSPTMGPTLPGVGPTNDDDLSLFDIHEPSPTDEEAMAQVLARVQELKGENHDLRDTINNLSTLNSTMQTDFETREYSLNVEMELLTKTVVHLEGLLRQTRRMFFFLTRQD
jgi:hypothetical protein